MVRQILLEAQQRSRNFAVTIDDREHKNAEGIWYIYEYKAVDGKICGRVTRCCNSPLGEVRKTAPWETVDMDDTWPQDDKI